MTDRVAVSLDELCRLFERLEDGVFFWDRDLKLLARNDLACRLYNLDPAVVTPGLDIIDFVDVFPPRVWARNVPPVNWRGGSRQATHDRIRADFAAGMSFELRFVDPDRIVVGNRATFRDGLLITVVTDVTSREKNARALEREKTYLQTIIDNLDEGVALIQEDGRCIAYNSRLLELYGVDPDVVKPGDPVERFIRAGRDLDMVSDTEREELLADRLQRATTQIPGTVRFTRQMADGRLLEASRTGLPDGRAVIVVCDATERAELARQQTYLNAIVDNMAEGVALLDPDGRLIAFNQQAFDQYDVKRGTIQPGEHVSRFVAQHRDLDGLPEDEQARRRAERLALALRRDKEPVEMRRELGTGRILSVTRTPLDGGALFTYRDVTAEEERKTLLERAQQEAEQASRMKSEFLARISHELRTPMQGVLGMAALLGRTQLDEHQQRCLDVVKASGRHMLQLIEDLLTISTIEAEGLRLHPEAVELNDLVSDAVEMIRPRADERGLSLAFEPGPAGAIEIEADVTRTTQIVINLLSNAVRYTRSGSVTVRASAVPGSTEGLLAVEVAITDTGVGIPDDKLEVIFERFSQLEAARGEVNEGVGLGLAVARSLARLMGGDILVETALGEGSTFALRVELTAAKG